MAIQYSTTVNNAKLDQIESTIGTAPLLKIRTGSAPANCGTADSGTALVSVTLPSDWMANASAAAKAKSGTWSGTASNTGTAAHWRLYDSSGVTCHMQGTFGTSGTDMIGDSTSFTAGQTFTVNTFTINAANT
jgi:hypothetical protein